MAEQGRLAFSTLVKRSLGQRQMSIVDLARATGLDYKRLTNWLSAQGQISPSDVVEIAKALKLDPIGLLYTIGCLPECYQSEGQLIAARDAAQLELAELQPALEDARSDLATKVAEAQAMIDQATKDARGQLRSMRAQMATVTQSIDRALKLTAD